MGWSEPCSTLTSHSYPVFLASAHFSAKASCVAVLMPSSVFDCKREGESTVDFVANCTFATGLVRGGGKWNFASIFLPLFVYCLFSNSSVIAFHLVKGTLFLFLVFLLIVFLALSSDVWEHCWECHVVLVLETNLDLPIKARSSLVGWWA